MDVVRGQRVIVALWGAGESHGSAAAYAAAAAFDMSIANRAWGISAGDFWVVTDVGRIVHVVGDSPTIVYAARCQTPGPATEQALICQALRSR